MNDITEVLYTWLSNSPDIYGSIQLRAGNAKDLRTIVEEGITITDDQFFLVFEGVLDDLLNLADWQHLFNELVEY